MKHDVRVLSYFVYVVKGWQKLFYVFELTTLRDGSVWDKPQLMCCLALFWKLAVSLWKWVGKWTFHLYGTTVSHHTNRFVYEKPNIASKMPSNISPCQMIDQNANEHSFTPISSLLRPWIRKIILTWTCGVSVDCIRVARERRQSGALSYRDWDKLRGNGCCYFSVYILRRFLVATDPA